MGLIVAYQIPAVFDRKTTEALGLIVPDKLVALAAKMIEIEVASAAPHFGR